MMTQKKTNGSTENGVPKMTDFIPVLGYVNQKHNNIVKSHGWQDVE